jgi:hypothetical protein
MLSYPASGSRNSQSSGPGHKQHYPVPEHIFHRYLMKGIEEVRLAPGQHRRPRHIPRIGLTASAAACFTAGGTPTAAAATAAAAQQGHRTEGAARRRAARRPVDPGRRRRRRRRRFGRRYFLLLVFGLIFPADLGAVAEVGEALFPLLPVGHRRRRCGGAAAGMMNLARQ